MGRAVRFQETPRRLAMIDEGFVKDQAGLGIDPAPPSALDLARPGAVKSSGVLQAARRPRRPSATMKPAGAGGRHAEGHGYGLVLFASVMLVIIGCFDLHVGVLGRGLVPLLLTAAMVTLLLYTIVDLDRPARGLIQVPDTSLIHLRATMNLPPAAGNNP
jgi:hypothetical protein